MSGKLTLEITGHNSNLVMILLEQQRFHSDFVRLPALESNRTYADCTSTVGLVSMSRSCNVLPVAPDLIPRAEVLPPSSEFFETLVVLHHRPHRYL